MTKKIQVLNTEGKKIKDIDTDLFDGNIREDIVQKIVEIEKLIERAKQVYAPFYLAGNQTSASGNVKHNRHVWKTDRGKGLSRIPKKQMSRKGDRFVWEGAVIPSTKGGRSAHPPKVLKRIGKINKKEFLIGLKSALKIVASRELVKRKYSSLKDKSIDLTFPLIIDSKFLNLKSKDFFNVLEKILKDFKDIAFQEKKIRAGKGKMRGRKYRNNDGMLLILGNEENKKVIGLDVVNVKDLNIKDLASNGARLCMFTEMAVKDLENKFKDKKNDKTKSN